MSSTKTTLIILALIVLAPAPVFAINSSTRNTAIESAATSQTAETDRANDTVKSCEQAQTKLERKNHAYNTAREAHSKAFDNLLTRLNRFTGSIKAKGFNTTTLDGDIVILKNKIDEFNTLIADSDQQMRQTAQGACTKTSLEEKSLLAKTRNRVRITHQKAAEIRNFYLSVVKPDLLELKAQNPGAVSNSTNTNAGTTE